MLRLFETLIVLLLIALVPIRATASVAIAFHSADHRSAATYAHDGVDHEVAPHQGDEAPGDVNHGCSYGAGHCVGASLIAPCDTARFHVGAKSGPIASGERLASGHVPEHLDRPPLAF